MLKYQHFVGIAAERVSVRKSVGQKECAVQYNYHARISWCEWWMETESAVTTYTCYWAFKFCKYSYDTDYWRLQGCVRGQHGPGQGQGSSRPRPQILSSRSRPVLEDPHTWAFYSAMLRREWLCHIVCLSITLKFTPYCRLLYLCMKYCIYGIESFTVGHTQKSTSYGQILKPKPRPRIVKAKAKSLRGQGHKILSSRSRPVLEDPIPDWSYWTEVFYLVYG